MSTETKSTKVRRTPKQVTEDASMMVTQADIDSLMLTFGNAPAGFNSELYVGTWWPTRHLSRKKNYERVLVEGDPNHPDIDPREFSETKYEGARTITRIDTTYIYMLRSGHKKIVQALADQFVGSKARSTYTPGAVGGTQQQIEHSAPNTISRLHGVGMQANIEETGTMEFPDTGPEE